MKESIAPPVQARKPRGQYAKSETTRQAILEAALEVFAQSGYDSGSIRQVAQRVGMSEAGLLHHFSNKVAILQAVLAYRDDLAKSFVDDAIEDGAETLRGLVSLAAHNAENPGTVELYCKLAAEATTSEHPAHSYFVGRYEWARAIFTEAFAKLARDGRLVQGVEPMRASITTLALMDGLQVQWLLDRSVVDMAQELEDYFRSVVLDFDVESVEPESHASLGAGDIGVHAGNEVAI